MKPPGFVSTLASYRKSGFFYPFDHHWLYDSEESYNIRQFCAVACETQGTFPGRPGTSRAWFILFQAMVTTGKCHHRSLFFL